MNETKETFSINIDEPSAFDSGLYWFTNADNEGRTRLCMFIAGDPEEDILSQDTFIVFGSLIDETSISCETFKQYPLHNEAWDRFTNGLRLWKLERPDLEVNGGKAWKLKNVSR